MVTVVAPSPEAEYLAPTTDTGLLAVVTTDKRVKHITDVTGEIAAHLVKIPLAADGLPVATPVFRHHHSTPIPAYIAVGNDDSPQWPALSYRFDPIGAVIGAGLGLCALIVAGLSIWVMTR